MNNRVMDAIGIALLLIGLTMTALLWRAHRTAPIDLESVVIQEIPSAPHAPPAFPSPGSRQL
jgi:hypothetical protein